MRSRPATADPERARPFRGARPRLCRLEPRVERGERLVEARGVAPGAAELELTRSPVEHGLRAPDDAVPDEDRQHVVAVLALRLGDVHLEPVAEVEERFGAVAVVHEPVEGREERYAVGYGGVVDLGMGVPLVADPLHPERSPAALRELALGVGEQNGLDVRVPPLREIPEPMPRAAPDDRDGAAVCEELQHDRDVPRAPPRMLAVALLRGAVLELAREQRPAALELPQDVLSEGRVLAQERHPHALGRRPTGPPPTHPRAQQRQRVFRVDERAPLEELPLDPEEPVELRRVVRAEAAPEDETLRRCDRRDRIDLEKPDSTDRVEH